MTKPREAKPPDKPDASRLVTRDGEIWLLAQDGVTWNYWGPAERGERPTFEGRRP